MSTYIIPIDEGFYEDFLDAAGDFFVEKEDSLPCCRNNGITITHYIEAWFRHIWIKETNRFLPSTASISLNGKEIYVLTHESCAIYEANVIIAIQEILDKRNTPSLLSHQTSHDKYALSVELADLNTIILREISDE